MPKRDYYYCMKCSSPLENPCFRQVETYDVFLEFALCEGCRLEMLKPSKDETEEPTIVVMLAGETLKKLLKPKEGTLLVMDMTLQGEK